MPYSFASGGTLCFEHDRDDSGIAVTSNAIALLFDGEGVLYKHGSPEKVRQQGAKLRAALHAAGLAGAAGEVTLVEIPVAALKVPAVLEEVNACLAISGRVKGIVARLAALAPATDALPT